MTRLTTLLLCYALACTDSTPPEPPLSGMLSRNFQGVWTNPNPHSQVPEGAARSAENLVNPKPGVASVVEGQETLANAYSAADERLSTGTTFDGFLIESTNGAVDKLYRRDPMTLALTAYSGSFSPPSGVVRMSMADVDDKLHLATNQGVLLIDGVTSTPQAAGIPTAQSLFTNPATGTLLTAGQSVAYRYVISRADSKGIFRRGTPSGREVYVAGGAEAVELTMVLPAGLVGGERLEIYRTGISPAGVDPGDTMFLVSQTLLVVSAYVTLGTNTVIDDTPDSLRGEPLYTNSALGGILRRNERPPLAKHLIGFDNFLALANVKNTEQFTLRCVGLPDPGDIITIDGVDYVADGLTPPNRFFIGASGTVAQRIEFTAQSLITAINTRIGVSPAREVQAFYVSSPSDPPGIILIEALSVTKAPFGVAASANGDRYEPQLDTTQFSLATTEPNGLWFSKRDAPYAFPPLRSATGGTYRLRIGNTGRDILGLATIRNYIIVFVDKEGVFRVARTGAETWRVDRINENANLLIPGSLAVVDNQVIAWTTRGLVAVDESGVEEIDLPIKDQFRTLQELGPDVILPYTFAVGDEDRLRYVLYHPTSASDTTATHAWVYNADHGTWTERTDPSSGGFVGGDDGLLYLGAPTANTLTRERTGTPAQRFKRPDGTAIPVRLEMTLQDEQHPFRKKQYTDFFLRTLEKITGNLTVHFTNDLGSTQSATGATSAAGEPYVHMWVPDGTQNTTSLKVDIRRDVFEQNFEVVALELWPAGTYKGGLTR